jgi:hypothetical protein
MISLVRGGEFRTISSKKSGELATQEPEKVETKTEMSNCHLKLHSSSLMRSRVASFLVHHLGKIYQMTIKATKHTEWP